MHLREYIRQRMIHHVERGNPVWLVKPFTIDIYLTTAANQRTFDVAMCFDHGPVFNGHGEFCISSLYGIVVIGLASETWIYDIDMREPAAVKRNSTLCRVLNSMTKQVNRLANYIRSLSSV